MGCVNAKLSSVRKSQFEAVKDIVQQQEELLKSLIGYMPDREEITKKGHMVTKPDGNEVFSWEGDALVEFTQFSCYEVDNKEVRCVKGYNLL